MLNMVGIFILIAVVVAIVVTAGFVGVCMLIARIVGPARERPRGGNDPRPQVPPYPGTHQIPRQPYDPRQAQQPPSYRSPYR